MPNRHRNILLVEDDVVALDMIVRQCATPNITFRTATSIAEAAAAVAAAPPDLLLLDYLLPDGTAFELLDCLQAGAVSPPFVVLTGSGDEKVAVAMMKRGAIDYLVKDRHLLEVLPLVIDRALSRLVTEEELSEAQAALTHSEERYRLLFENMTAGFALHEVVCNDSGRVVDYRFLDVNPAFERLTGLRADTIIGRTVKEVLPATENYWIETYGRVALSGEAMRYQDFSGALNAHFDVWCFSPHHGQFATIFSDISEQVCAEEARRAVERQLLANRQHLLEAQRLGKIASFEWDLQSGRIEWTPQGYLLLEREAGTFEQTIEQWFAFVHPDDRDRLHQDIVAAMKSGGETRSEYRLVMPDGRHKHIVTTGHIVRDENGESSCIVGVSQDVTERKHVEISLAESRDRAEVANRAKSEFLANLSHELRTPLNGILGVLQLLNDGNLSQEQAEYVEIATKSGWSLLNLLNDLLDLSMVEAGRMELKESSFDLIEEVRASVGLFSQAAAEKGLVLRSSVDGHLPRFLLGDVVRIRQILLNLLGNAVKFTEQGEISIAVRFHAPSRTGRTIICLRVNDTGIGMAQELVGRACEPFVQGEGSYNRRFQGAGLGLSIVKRLCELMNGELRIDSRVGVGTSVEVLFEAGVVEEQIASSSAERGAIRPDSPTLEPLRLLIAEDNPINQLAVASLLKKRGHLVTTVCNGYEALESLKSHSFDLILMDVQMPELDGLEATRRIRGDASGRIDSEIPIIALTSFAMERDREACIAAGMNEFLPKPFDIRQLEKLLHRFAADRLASSH